MNAPLTVNQPSLSASVRRKGLMRFTAGLMVFALGLVFVLLLLPRMGLQLNPGGLVLFAFPGAYGLSGLVELITGVRFTQFARRWDALKGWQRGIFGTFIVLMAGAIILITVAFFVS